MHDGDRWAPVFNHLFNVIEGQLRGVGKIGAVEDIL